MRNRVAISSVHNEDIEAAVREAVRLAGGFDEVIGHNSTVLIKPNQCKPCPRRSGFVTDGDVVAAVTKLVLERNPASVVIGDGAIAGWDFEGFSTQESFDASGVTEVADRLGVELRNLNADAVEEVEVPGGVVFDSVRIAKTAVDADVIISVPVLKMGIRTHVSLSLKNMKGVMPGGEKRRSHRVGLDMAIADLCSIVKPHYAIIDATVGSEGMGDYPQDAREMALIVAGRDPLSVDMVGASLMGVEPHEVLHLRHFAARDNRHASLDGIEVVGERLEDHRQLFTRPFDVFRSRFPEVAIIQGESACSGCMNELIGAMIHTKRAGYEEQMAGLTVVIGNASETPATDRLIGIGTCAAGIPGACSTLAGCPPKEADIVRAIARICDFKPEAIIESMEATRLQIWDAARDLLNR